MVKQKSNHGFTLFEVLIALSIFSIVMLIAYAGFSNITEVKKRLSLRGLETKNFLNAMTVVRRDLMQYIEKKITNENLEVESSFYGDMHYIQFTKVGPSNLHGEIKAFQLERVAYELQKGKLIRRSWPVTDRIESTKAIEQVLLEGHPNAYFSYIDYSGKEQEIAGSKGLEFQILPKVIKINLFIDEKQSIPLSFLLNTKKLSNVVVDKYE